MLPVLLTAAFFSPVPRASRSIHISWKPNKWLALLLGAIAGPLGALYAGYPLLAALLFVVTNGGMLALFLWNGAFFAAYGPVVQLLVALLFAGLSFELARRCAVKPRQPWYARWWALVAIIVVVLTSTLLFRVFLYEPFRSGSNAMLPAITDRSHVFVEKSRQGRLSAYRIHFGTVPPKEKLERGEIIAFEYPPHPESVFFMRIVGVPGDTVVYRERRLFLNGADVRGKSLGQYLDKEDKNNFNYLDRYSETIGNTTFEILLHKEPPQHPPYGAFDLKDDCVLSAVELKCVVPAGRYFVMGDSRDNSNDSRFWGFVPQASVIGKVVRVSH